MPVTVTLCCLVPEFRHRVERHLAYEHGRGVVRLRGSSNKPARAIALDELGGGGDIDGAWPCGPVAPVAPFSPCSPWSPLGPLMLTVAGFASPPSFVELRSPAADTAGVGLPALWRCPHLSRHPHRRGPSCLGDPVRPCGPVSPCGPVLPAAPTSRPRSSLWAGIALRPGRTLGASCARRAGFAGITFFLQPSARNARPRRPSSCSFVKSE